MTAETSWGEAEGVPASLSTQRVCFGKTDGRAVDFVEYLIEISTVEIFGNGERCISRRMATRHELWF